MAKVPKSKSARPKSRSRKADRAPSRQSPNLRALREHEFEEEPSRYRVVSSHGPIFGGIFEGRAHEFSGLGLIAFGALLVLSVYLKLAGPLGRALDAFSS